MVESKPQDTQSVKSQQTTSSQKTASVHMHDYSKTWVNSKLKEFHKNYDDYQKGKISKDDLVYEAEQQGFKPDRLFRKALDQDLGFRKLMRNCQEFKKDEYSGNLNTVYEGNFKKYQRKNKLTNPALEGRYENRNLQALKDFEKGALDENQFQYTIGQSKSESI